MAFWEHTQTNHSFIRWISNRQWIHEIFFLLLKSHNHMVHVDIFWLMQTDCENYEVSDFCHKNQMAVGCCCIISKIRRITSTVLLILCCQVSLCHTFQAQQRSVHCNRIFHSFSRMEIACWAGKMWCIYWSVAGSQSAFADIIIIESSN